MKHYLIKKAISTSLSVIAVSLCLSSIALASDDNLSLNADVGYVNASSLPTASTTSINKIRLKSLKDTAMTLGATGALAWRSVQINTSISKEQSYLNKIFDFNQLLINNNILPPVLTESDDSLNMDSSTSLRLASKSYKIVSPARFVTAAPTWRNYLEMNYQKPDLPNESLLPKTQDEANAWNQYLKKGWEEGLTQANSIFNDNLNRLKRDYAGIVLYRKLLAQHIVSAPYVAKSDLGVTGDENNIRVNDKVLRISAPSKLQTDTSKWTPVINKNNSNDTGTSTEKLSSANNNKTTINSISGDEGAVAFDDNTPVNSSALAKVQDKNESILLFSPTDKNINKSASVTWTNSAITPLLSTIAQQTNYKLVISGVPPTTTVTTSITLKNQPIYQALQQLQNQLNNSLTPAAILINQYTHEIILHYEKINANWNKTATIKWNGQLETLLTHIATANQYQLQVLGNTPNKAIYLNFKSEHDTLLSDLKSIQSKVGDSIKIGLNQNTHMLTLTYK